MNRKNETKLAALRATPPVARVYKTEPITTIPFNSIAIMRLFGEYDLNAQPLLMEQAEALYGLVNEYETAKRHYDRALGNCASCVDSLQKGFVAFYNLSREAQEVDLHLNTMREKVSSFRKIVRLLGYKAEDIPNVLV